MSDEQAPRRVEIWYRGRVQGVGFRATTRHVAAGYRVTGFVKNLVDGRVQLVAEGLPDEIERFLAAVDDELGRYIVGRDRHVGEAIGEFLDFDIH